MVMVMMDNDYERKMMRFMWGRRRRKMRDDVKEENRFYHREAYVVRACENDIYMDYFEKLFCVEIYR